MSLYLTEMRTISSERDGEGRGGKKREGEGWGEKGGEEKGRKGIGREGGGGKGKERDWERRGEERFSSGPK